MRERENGNRREKRMNDRNLKKVQCECTQDTVNHKGKEVKSVWNTWRDLSLLHSCEVMLNVANWQWQHNSMLDGFFVRVECFEFRHTRTQTQVESIIKNGTAMFTVIKSNRPVPVCVCEDERVKKGNREKKCYCHASFNLKLYQ